MLQEYLASAVPGGSAPKALIVPHAGYVYSGAVAASAYRGLVGLADSIDRVILAGPTHRVPVPGIAVPEVAAFDTPLGRVPVDTATVSRLLSLPHVYATNLPHRIEHSLEVQLPFLQVTLEQFSLVPLAVGDATAATVADVLEACWGGPETLVVVSTDLSHYHRYDEAVAIDARTAAAIVAADHDRIGDRDACGARPLRGVLRVAERRHLTVEQLDLRNSGDTAGDRHRVVGYGAFRLT